MIVMSALTASLFGLTILFAGMTIGVKVGQWAAQKGQKKS